MRGRNGGGCGCVPVRGGGDMGMGMSVCMFGKPGRWYRGGSGVDSLRVVMVNPGLRNGSIGRADGVDMVR